MLQGRDCCTSLDVSNVPFAGTNAMLTLGFALGTPLDSHVVCVDICAALPITVNLVQCCRLLLVR